MNDGRVCTHHGHDACAASVVGAALKPHLAAAAFQPEDLRGLDNCVSIVIVAVALRLCTAAH